jgi:hypothetical protein
LRASTTVYPLGTIGLSFAGQHYGAISLRRWRGYGSLVCAPMRQQRLCARMFHKLMIQSFLAKFDCWPPVGYADRPRTTVLWQPGGPRARALRYGGTLR